VRVSNVAGGGATSGQYAWTRSVTVTLGDVGVRIDLLRRRRVRVIRPVDHHITLAQIETTGGSQRGR